VDAEQPLSRPERAETINAAVAATNGNVTFSVPGDYTISGRILKEGQASYGKEYSVHALEIDGLVRDEAKTADALILKIDTEGFEDIILPAISASQLAAIDFMLLEFWPSGDGAFEQHIADRYHVFSIDSVQFTSNDKFEEFQTAEALHSWGKDVLTRRKNVDIALVPRSSRRAKAVVSALRES